MSQTSTSADVVLSVRNLTVDLPPGMERTHAVKDISFDLHAGEILCIIGESGSGKSVTANAIMGLLSPVIKVSTGEIHFKGMDILAAREETLRPLRGQAVSIIFQDPLSALNPLMTVGDQIAEVLEAHRYGTAESRKKKVIDLLEEVGLPDPPMMRHQYPFRLSGGQRQRVMIAMALALDPDVLIADEPTTALDVTTQAQILDLIRKIQKRKGMSVMFITHDFGVVDPQRGLLDEGAQVVADLVHQFAGRREDEGTGRPVVRTGRVFQQHFDQRQAEGRRLAGAGLGQTDQVAAFQHDRDRLQLDRGRGVVAEACNRGGNVLRQAKLKKVGQF